MKDLVFVACHAPFKNSTAKVPHDPSRDDAWVLQDFQRGEAPLYINHIHRGVELAAANPNSLLILSGGFTRAEAAPRWSEASTYTALAHHFDWWNYAGVSSRCVGEDYSRDSFENVLFSICKFQQITGSYPQQVTGVSWAFKKDRFYAHARTIRFPDRRFRFEECGQPIDLASALKSEATTREAFSRNFYGGAGSLKDKRDFRNPMHRVHPFRTCPGLAAFFNFMDDPANATREYPGSLPWDEGED